MKLELRHIICPILAVAAITGGIVISRGELSRRAEISCGGIETKFSDSLHFVNGEDIKRIISRNYGSYIGQWKDSVRLGDIERILEKNCYIRNAELWMTDDGILHARIDQYRPVLLFRDAGFYCDRDLTLFPLKNDWEADVRTVEGIPSVKGKALKELLSGIISLCDTLERPDVWKFGIDSVYVGDKNEILLKCKGFDGFFIFGKTDEKKRKIEAMGEFYDKILPVQNGYRSVNLKYKNQIICRKDI